MTLSTTLDRSGRLVIPKEVRTQLNLEPETELVMTVEGDEIRLMSRAAARKRAQDELRKYIPEGVSLVEDLFEERRREVAREQEEWKRRGY